jgi:hypothetical protein
MKPGIMRKTREEAGKRRNNHLFPWIRLKRINNKEIHCTLLQGGRGGRGPAACAAAFLYLPSSRL